MTGVNYTRERTGLLLVDPSNDFLSEGGKLWQLLKEIAQEEHLPAALPAGIEPTDPMLQGCSAAYPVSYARRHP